MNLRKNLDTTDPQIRIHDDCCIALQIVNPRNHGDFLAEIAGQIDIRDARIFRAQFPHDSQRLIAAAIIDKDKLKIVAGKAPYHLRCTRIKLPQYSLLIVAWYQDRNQASVCIS